MTLIKKSLKLFFIFMAILIPAILIAGIAALFLVDSHHFKPQITQLTEDRLGRKLIIDGDFSLQFYPYIAIKLTQAHLKNPDSFGNLKNNDFAYINTAKLKIDLLPLLKGKISIEELILDGLTLNLTRLSPTQDNWSDLVTNLKPGHQDDDNKNDSENENGNLAKGKFKINLNETTLQKAELIYTDQVAHKSYQFKNVNFHTQKIDLKQPIKVDGDFIFIADKIKTAMTYTGQMLFNAKTSTLAFSPLNLKSTLLSDKLPHGKLITDLSGTLNADWPNQTFNLQNITLKFNDSIATGSAKIDFSAGLSARFNLNLNTLSIDKYVPDTHLTLSKIQTNGVFNNKILTLSSLKANLYNGNFQGSSKITFGPTNQYQVNGKFNQVNIQTLLSALKNINNISGTTLATLNLSTAGNAGAELKRNLTGQIYLSIHQGYLYGVDIEYYLRKAQSLAKRLPPDSPLVDNKKTPFDQLTGNFIFQNGVITNQDLQGSARFYQLTGAGKIDLVQEQMAYQLKANTLKTDGSQSKVPLAVRISGPLSHPQVRPDLETYIQYFAQEQIKKQLNKQLNKQLGIPLPGTEGAASPNGNTDGSNNTLDKKALQKELINKGLQKLFGR